MNTPYRWIIYEMIAALKVSEYGWLPVLQGRGDLYSEVANLHLTLHVEEFVFN